jgi:hypothetical protein
MSTEKINHALLTAAWMSSDATLLDEGGAGDQPLAFLGSQDAFADHFDAAQYRLKTGALSPLSLPWMSQKGQKFWYYYLKRTINGQVDGYLAWKKITPLRLTIPLQITAAYPSHPDLIFNINAEGFLYPHTVAALITAAWTAETNLTEFEDLAYSIRRDKIFKTAWHGHTASDLFQSVSWPVSADEQVSLGAIGLNLIRAFRAAVFGPGIAGGRLTDSSPFTILSVLGGANVDLTAAPPANGQIQRLLHTITAWERVPEGAEPLELSSQVNLGLGKLAGPADLLYGARRGRAVWYPSKFLQDEQPNFKLRCYHRNLMYASLQTEALYGHAVELAQRRASNAPVTTDHHTLTRRAAATLGLLYGAHHDTYRSQSPRRQIDDNHWIDVVNSMRQYNYMQPLS